MIIPLDATPFQSFNVALNDNSISFDVKWNETGQLFLVDIGKNGVNLIKGRGLHIGMDLFENIDIDGTAILSGNFPTPDNLGVDCELVYVDQI